MELWDLYDVNRQKLNETMVRGDEYPKNKFHIVVHACVFNKKNQMLIQQRQPFKKGWSNMWDITMGGSTVTNEESALGCERELLEEIGLKVDLSDVRPNFTVNFQHGFDDYYLIDKEVDLSTLKLQYEEVQAVKWASKQEIKEMIKEGTFVPYFDSLIDLMFDMRGHYGAHSK